MPQGVSTRHITLLYTLHIRLDRCRADIIVMSARHMLPILCRAAHILCIGAHVRIVLHGIRFLCLGGQGYALENIDMPWRTCICIETKNICLVRLYICRAEYMPCRLYAVQDMVPWGYALQDTCLHDTYISTNAYLHGVSSRQIIYLLTQRWLNIRRARIGICRAEHMPCRLYAVQDMVPWRYALKDACLHDTYISTNAYLHGVPSRRSR